MLPEADFWRRNGQWWWQLIISAGRGVRQEGIWLNLVETSVARFSEHLINYKEKFLCILFYSQVSRFVAVTSDSHPFCPNTDKCSWFQSLNCYIISHGHRVHLNQDLYIIELRMTSEKHISNSMFPRAWPRTITVSNVCPVTS